VRFYFDILFFWKPAWTADCFCVLIILWVFFKKKNLVDIFSFVYNFLFSFSFCTKKSLGGCY
jgi:hypothetical protein